MKKIAIALAMVVFAASVVFAGDVKTEPVKKEGWSTVAKTEKATTKKSKKKSKKEVKPEIKAEIKK